MRKRESYRNSCTCMRYLDAVACAVRPVCGWKVSQARQIWNAFPHGQLPTVVHQVAIAQCPLTYKLNLHSRSTDCKSELDEKSAPKPPVAIMTRPCAFWGFPLCRYSTPTTLQGTNDASQCVEMELKKRQHSNLAVFDNQANSFGFVQKLCAS